MLARNGRAVSLGIIGLVVALVPGCSGESTGTVSGSVKFKGKEMDGGYVVFQNEKNTTSPPVRAKIGSDGNYSAPGVLYGVNKVGVEPPTKSLEANMPKGIAEKGKFTGDNAAKMKGMYSNTEGTYVEIPREFRTPETSKIVVTVDSGAKSFNIEIPPK